MAQDKIIEEVTSGEYKYGFTTDVQTDIIGKGLNEDVIRTISMKKGEPAWLLEFRLKAYRKWLTMPVPKWAHLNIPDIDFQDISYYAAPKVNNQMANDKKVNVLGVIRPTVEAVPSISRTGHVGILATPATVSSESYVLELEKQPHLTSPQGEESPLLGRGTGRGFSISQQPCPLWVPLIENGEHLKPGADYFVDKYLRELLSKDPLIDTLILGCTHYPLLLPKINKWLQSYSEERERSYSKAVLQQSGLTAVGGLTVISQGALVARSLADYLRRHPEYESQLSQSGSCHYLTTENADRFSQSASLFLSAPVSAEHIDLE
jgi:glutamate racemase